MKSNYDKEILSMIYALIKWRQYLLGRKFSIRIDLKNLQFLLQQKTLSIKQNKWMEKMSTFYMETLNKRGKDNVVVVALSRRDEVITSCTTLVVVPD